MKKFIVSVNILLSQSIDYEIKANSMDEVTKLLSENNIEDIGKCIDESIPELYSETIDNIKEEK